MKKIGSRSVMILILTLAFFAGLVYHTVNLTLHTKEWVASPMNRHLPEHDQLEYAGKIIDRNGVILAQSINEKRYYNEDEETRMACLHIVGDNSVNIATAIQTVYRSSLTSFEFNGDFLFGLGLPTMMDNKNEIDIIGNDVTLTIDSRIQKAALKALGSYKGAVFIYNYKTGEIICMVSTPTYDPQNVPYDIETNDKYDGAYLNRALSASYPPGSTFKIVTAAAAVSEIPDISKSAFDCRGTDTIGGKPVTCFQHTPHGHIDLTEALAKSCNIFFAKLSVALGKDKMTSYAEQMGFNHDITFDGIVTADSVYKVDDASENELAWSGVGQYTVLETPVNMAMISAAVANGGTPVMPYFIQSMGPITKNTTTLGTPMMEKSVADQLRDMMEYTASTYNLNDTFRVCGKTGTAEISDNGDVAHAWFTGFLLSEDCPYAFSIILEQAENGSSEAVEAMNQILANASTGAGAEPALP